MFHTVKMCSSEGGTPSVAWPMQKPGEFARVVVAIIIGTVITDSYRPRCLRLLFNMS